MGRDRIILRATIPLVAAVVAAAGAVRAQIPRSAATEARREGLALLTRAFEAMGGPEQLEALRSVRLNAELTQYQVGQGPRPDEPALRLGTSTYSLVRNLQTGEWYLEASSSRDAPGPGLRFVHGREDSFRHDLLRDTVSEIPDGFDMETLADRLPYAPAVLLAALDRSETVRRLPPPVPGTTAFTYADSAGLQITLTFDDRGLLRSREVVERHGQLGDVARASIFSDYRTVDGLRLPFEIVGRLGPVATTEAAVYDATLNPAVDRDIFRRPEGVPQAPTQGRPAVAGGAQMVEEIVPGVFQILNVTPLYNVMLVRQDEDVYVIEAPGDQTAYELVRDSAAAVLGGREISALVLTHHHFDHSSNLWRYLASGTRVIAPAGHEAFVRSVAAAPRLDASGAPPLEPEIELVEGRRMIGAGPNRFELIDAGPNPHAEEILIAHFPEHKLLWVPDIYGYYPGFTPPPLLLSFADRFEELDLDVEIIATAHTELSSVAELRDMIARARERSGQAGGGDR